jgi:Transglycosylase SLT domain
VIFNKKRFKSAWIGSVLLCFLQQSAWADVWGYIDAKGVAHFAAERVDERYELFFKGGEAFDTAKGVKGPIDTPRPVALPAAPTKLLAFFDVSPSFKAVKHIMREASTAHNIDMELLQALIATESGFDALAVSPKGAVGLMQIIPPTAQRYGVLADKTSSIEKKLTDPRINIKAGTRYLRDLINMFGGKLELALAAYNAGEGAVQRAGNRIPNYPETQNYVKTVLQIYNQLKPPATVTVQRDLQTPGRVRMELPQQQPGVPVIVPTAGGAMGRSNMVPPLTAAPVLPDFKIERD